MLYDESKVKKIIEEFNRQYSFCGKTTTLLPSFSREIIVDGIGTIAILYNGDIELTKKLIVLALRTHNKIVLITSISVEENMKIVNWINKKMAECDYSNNDIALKSLSHNEFYAIQKTFDMLLVIGTIKDYSSILPHLVIPSTFYQFGEYNVFVDKELTLAQKESLKEIDKIAYDNDYIINYLDISNLEAIKAISNNGKNQSISVYTNVKEHSYYIISSVTCSNISINSHPFKKIEFNENDFICKKHIFME